MSGTVNLTIGGAFNGHTGVVTVPSSLLFGQPSTSGSINNALQSYLFGVYQGLVSGADNFENYDLPAGQNLIAPGSVGGGATFEEFTNITSLGGSTSGVNPPATVSAGVTDLLVQTPGDVTLTGVGTTTQAVFGAGSNVTYSVTNPAAGTIYLAGGANSVTLFDAGLANAETIYSAGNDTINLAGNGTDYVSVYGNAVVEDEGAVAYVTAEGNATTNFFWDDQNAGGSLHFVNNSSGGAFIHIGIFNGVQSAAHVTAYGGVGGGYYVGGTGGSNSLVGGVGLVTLVGGGSGDFLEAQSSLGTNVLAAGNGTETLVATSTTGSNIFGAGLNYPGIGDPQASGVISTDGSGFQTFFLGNVPGGESVFGSTQAGAFNNYDVVGINNSTQTVGGGTYSIYNFTNNHSTIFLSNGAGGAGDATIASAYVDPGHSTQYDINLSDGTTILLKGLTSSEISSITTGSITGIGYYIQG